MEALSIKIKIGDREYPMRVEPEDEERIRQASRMLNEQIQHYRQSYNTTDKQDLLAVVAFDAFLEKLAYQTQQAETEKVIADKIGRLNRLISQAIS
ncbi:cell division protein ZapA [Tunicatimonas pelagia]|uniref:cell division protein ZapA n=1 Tax=Tunicatimonas pelagia TaxID=931531 RepID=UPI0026657D4E|nr:cell division protein ZapA [Tunicatimonas pelagia]WKN45726.1 cell division protein ZapA [Tunicatimonas pelagia]